MYKSEIIAMRSLTEAMRIRDMLARNGIGAALIRSPGGEKGCGYSLKISGETAKAGKLIKEFRTGGDV